MAKYDGTPVTKPASEPAEPRNVESNGPKSYSAAELFAVGTTVDLVQGRMLYGLYDMILPDRRLP